jgi:hypothetical protein
MRSTSTIPLSLLGLWSTAWIALTGFTVFWIAVDEIAERQSFGWLAFFTAVAVVVLGYIAHDEFKLFRRQYATASRSPDARRARLRVLLLHFAIPLGVFLFMLVSAQLVPSRSPLLRSLNVVILGALLALAKWLGSALGGPFALKGVDYVIGTNNQAPPQRHHKQKLYTRKRHGR